jgi:hypothetical protein
MRRAPAPLADHTEDSHIRYAPRSCRRVGLQRAEFGRSFRYTRPASAPAPRNVLRRHIIETARWAGVDPQRLFARRRRMLASRSKAVSPGGRRLSLAAPQRRPTVKLSDSLLAGPPLKRLRRQPARTRHWWRAGLEHVVDEPELGAAAQARLLARPRALPALRRCASTGTRVSAGAAHRARGPILTHCMALDGVH